MLNLGEIGSINPGASWPVLLFLLRLLNQMMIILEVQLQREAWCDSEENHILLRYIHFIDMRKIPLN